MALSDEEREELEYIIEQMEAEVEEQSIAETQSLIAILRIYHWLSTHNQSNELKPSKSGGITLSKEILKTMGYGFISANHVRPQSFIIEMQETEFDMFNQLELQAAWIEHHSVCLMFKPVKFADYLLPPIRLTFNITSPVIFDKIKDECEFATIALITPNLLEPGRMTVREVKNPVAPLLQEAPAKIDNNRQFMRAFT